MAVPLLLGLVGVGASDPDCALANRHALRDIVASLREKYPSTPVVISVSRAFGFPRFSEAEAAALGVGFEVDADTPTGAVRDLVRDVDLLLAIVDGADAAAVEPIIAERMRGPDPLTIPASSLLYPPDVGPCVRAASTATVANSGPEYMYPERYSGDRSAPADFVDSLRCRDALNASVDALAGPELGIATLQSAVDAVANRLQRRMRLGRSVLYVLAFVAATAQILSKVPAFHGANLVIISGIAAAAAVVTLLAFRRQDHQNRYQDYRAVGEALRVLEVWDAAGVQARIADAYLPMQATELVWIRDLLRVVDAQRPRRPPLCEERAGRAITAWANGQREYSLRRSREEAAARDFVGRAGLVFGALTLLAAVATSFAGFYVKGHHGPPDGILPWIEAGGSWAAVCAAISHSYRQGRGYAQNANRYQRMYFVFDRAHRILADGTDADTARSVALQLGRQALAEHAEWLIAQREHPLALIHTSAT